MFKPVTSFPVVALILMLGCPNANSATKAAIDLLHKSETPLLGSPRNSRGARFLPPASGGLSPVNLTFARGLMSSVVASSAALTPTTVATKSDPLPGSLVIPGERVGPVTRNTTRENLAQWFGKSRLRDQSVNIGEGFTEPGTRVDLGPERSFTVIWSDRTHTKPVEVRNLGSAWQTPQGIRIGTPLSQLQQKLGPFQLFGFGWDYGGTVVLEGTKLAQYQKTLVLRLTTAPNVAQRAPNDYQAVLGDRKFSSTNPHFKSLGVKVGEMIVRLSPI